MALSKHPRLPDQKDHARLRVGPILSASAATLDERGVFGTMQQKTHLRRHPRPRRSGPRSQSLARRSRPDLPIQLSLPEWPSASFPALARGGSASPNPQHTARLPARKRRKVLSLHYRAIYPQVPTGMPACSSTMEKTRPPAPPLDALSRGSSVTAHTSGQTVVIDRESRCYDPAEFTSARSCWRCCLSSVVGGRTIPVASGRVFLS